MKAKSASLVTCLPSILSGTTISLGQPLSSNLYPVIVTPSSLSSYKKHCIEFSIELLLYLVNLDDSVPSKRTRSWDIRKTS